jgi:ABC-2 type transport system ATP-binding protein
MNNEAKKQPAILLDTLSKRYSGTDRYALHGVSLSVYPGEVYGFLGPNGAGKSTAIRTLMNFIQPTEGNARILQYDIVKDSVEIKKSVGYLSGDFSVYPKMTGGQYLQYMNALQPADKSYTKLLTKKLKADTHKKLGTLSRGNRQKIGLIQAFMHRPNVLILDEPTSGLDPLMQEVFYELIAESKARGAAIFVSSHILSEVQRICDRVGIIRDGKLIEERQMHELSIVSAQTFDITFSHTAPVKELQKIKGLKIISNKDSETTVQLQGKLSPLFAVLAKHDVIKIDARNLDLEDVFLRFYQDKGSKK